MNEEAESVVRAGAPENSLVRRRVAFMRYHGQGHEIEVELPDRFLVANDLERSRSAFEAEYQRLSTISVRRRHHRKAHENRLRQELYAGNLGCKKVGSKGTSTTE